MKKYLFLTAAVAGGILLLFPLSTVTNHSSQPVQTSPETRVYTAAPNVLLDAPVVKQLPELPRGCEVTSLAMLLQHAGSTVDKLTLAAKVAKDPTKKVVQDGKTIFGNPKVGFVGNMYTFDQPGYGVYHAPIADLANDYLPNRIVDLTLQSFTTVKLALTSGKPVWVITNVTFAPLAPSYFDTWFHTDGSSTSITMKEHSVLLTGYDDKNVYFNDPLTGEKNKKAPIKEFVSSWVQMGSQAITYRD